MTFKCKKCLKNTVNFNAGDSVGVCGACGKEQTVPSTTDEHLLDLFCEANNLLLDCDFESAEKIYKNIIHYEDENLAEAYWGVVLCRYCVGYLFNKGGYECACICPKSVFASVKDDADFKSAVERADSQQVKILNAEAEIIDNIQKEIFDVMADGKPYDVFITCRESENNKQTQSSKEAKAIYNRLRRYSNVFYAPETLSGVDQMGRQYLTGILAAVNTAKLMLVFGSSGEQFNSDWVRAEWSRFLTLKRTDSNKKIIPCYMDMNVNDLPAALVRLKAEDITETESKFNLVDKATDYINTFRKSYVAESRELKSTDYEQKTEPETEKKQVKLPKINAKKINFKVIPAAVLAFLVVAGICCFNFLIKPSDSYKEMKIRSAKVGDFVSWGYYEQDGKERNGKEPIEWQVIDKNKNGTLLVSRYALDSLPYDTTYGDNAEVAWSDCSLVSWLNSTFADDSFNDNEREKIQETIVYDYDAEEYFHNKIFLLDAEEVRHYFPENRLCSETKYAAKNGTEQICSWWLRDGEADEKADAETDSRLIPYIDVDGNIHQYNGSSKGEKLAVRPAMWVNVEK